MIYTVPICILMLFIPSAAFAQIDMALVAQDFKLTFAFVGSPDESTAWKTTGTDFLYMKNESRPEIRKMAQVDCELIDGKSILKLSYPYSRPNEQIVGLTRPFTEIGDLSCENYLDSKKKLLTNASPTQLDITDQQLMKLVNKGLYKNIEKMGTMSFQHGHITDEVYVFLPGLYMSGNQFLLEARQKFNQGANVILTTLPGHERQSIDSRENSVGVWLAYSDYIVKMAARFYGKKVVLVGQSTGGLLAVRTAKNNKVDGLILHQPFFAVSKGVKAALAIGNLLPESLLNFSFEKYNLNEALKVAIEDQKLLEIPYENIPSDIPVTVFVADDDSVVSTKATLEWAKRYAPHAIIHHHSDGHMSISDF
ncbi:alpha/beta hydrolase [Bdellovibrio sp. GT3]|uniref:alpha/beta hydrolase n=1 Tax=Bdellovibrio sp. GT3 TaxID=3136282 RepID=UPI0030F3F739